MQAKIFREYDIRAVAGKEITGEEVLTLGRAIGTYMGGQGAATITLGRDCRTTSDRYRDLLAEGLVSTGLKVIDIGVCPTPILYFSVFHYQTDGGVMITASHNPPEYNGFKIMLGRSTIFGEQIQRIRRLADAGDFVEGHGHLEERDIRDAYLDHLASIIRIKRPLKVAIDAGNGVMGPWALPMMQRLGLEVTPLYCEMDGTFPNHEPDPTVMANLVDLQAAVKAGGLDAGFGFDGDGDRVGVVDQNAKPIYGDMLLAIYARSILKDNPGATIIGEVKCSKNLYDDIRKHGGRPIMWKTGHSLMKKKMVEEDALLAGEMSGHMFFKHRWFGFDDALYAALRLAELMSQTDAPLSTWLADIPEMVSTPEIRVDCPDELKFKVVEKVKADLSGDYEVVDIDGVRVETQDGWGLVRASNTQPALVLRFEAQSQARLDEIRELVETSIARAKKSL